MRYVLKIDEDDLAQLERFLWAKPGTESAAFLLAGVHEAAGQLNVLVRRVIEVRASDYRVRSRHRIELSPRAVNGLAALCDANRLTAVIAHSHPDPVPYSPSDDHGEVRIAGTLRAFSPRPEVGSLLLTPERTYGRVWQADDTGPVGLDELVVVGRRIRRISLSGGRITRPTPRSDIYARQILAFGEEGQRVMSGLKVGIVGAGGTGSPLAELLVRLGVKDIVLVDRDVFEPSNLSRVFGSQGRDARPSLWRRLLRRESSKVEIVVRHLRRIAPDSQIRGVVGDVAHRDVALRLLDRDVLFACTDEHWGRSILNQIAYQYLIPTLHLGAAITSDNGKIEDGVGVVQLLRPGHGCLWCCGFLNSDRIRAESLPRDEQTALESEGYLVGTEERAPSIVTVTTAVAALAGTWFIQLATDFMGEAGGFSRQNYDLLAGTVRRGQILPEQECICRKVKGRGDLTELPV
jgi:hypothetical protein